jgi:hypothetical protein
MGKAVMGAVEIGAVAGLDIAAGLVGGPLGAFIVNSTTQTLLGGILASGVAMEAGAIADALTQNRGMGITTRQPAAFRQIIYGEQRVGGVIIYQSTTGGKHDQYNFVIVLATHPCEAIVNLYLDGRQVYWADQGANGSRQNGDGTYFGGNADGNDHIGPNGLHYNFGGLVYCEMRRGEQVSGDVITGLTANDPTWAANANGNPWVGGCTYVYLKVEFDQGMFPTLPEIKFTVKGKNNIADPRTGTSGYSTNAALIVADAITDSSWGLNDNTVNQAQLIAAANICDQQVALAAGGTESQYSCHYHYDTSINPGDAIVALLKSCAGRLARIGGEWYIFPGAWLSTSYTLDESLLIGPVDWTPKRSLPDLFNRVRGTYIAPNYPYNVAGDLYDSNGYYNGETQDNFPFAFQPTNFPEYACDQLHGYGTGVDVYLTEDGGIQLPTELNLDCVLSIAQAQRLAKIHLLRNRQQGTLTLRLSIAAMQMQPCDVVQFTYAPEGFVNKYFEIQSWTLAQAKDQNHNIYPYVQVTLQETDPSVYESSTTDVLGPYDVPVIAGGIPYTVDPPTNLSIEDDTSTIMALADGNTMPRLLITWTPPLDTYVNNGGKIEVQYKLATTLGNPAPSVLNPVQQPDGTYVTGAWIDAGAVSGDSTSMYVDGISTAQYQSITVQVRAVRSSGAASAWAQVTGPLLSDNITWILKSPTDGGGPRLAYRGGVNLNDLQPAEAGADVTASNQSATTASLANHSLDNLADGTDRYASAETQPDNTANHHAVVPGSVPSSTIVAAGPATGTTIATITVDAAGPLDLFIVQAVFACASYTGSSGGTGTPTTSVKLTVDEGSTNYASAATVFGQGPLPVMGAITGLAAGEHTLVLQAFTDSTGNPVQFNANDSFVAVQHISSGTGGFNSAPAGGTKLVLPAIS